MIDIDDYQSWLASRDTIYNYVPIETTIVLIPVGIAVLVVITLIFLKRGGDNMT